MGIDSMHCLVFHSELQPEAKAASSIVRQKTGESTSIAEGLEGAQVGGGAAATCLFRVANQFPWVAIARVGGIQDELYCQGACCPSRQDRWLHVWPQVQEEGGASSEEVLDHPDDGSDIRVSMWSMLRWKAQPHNHRWHRHRTFWFLFQCHGKGNREALGSFKSMTQWLYQLLA